MSSLTPSCFALVLALFLGVVQKDFGFAEDVCTSNYTIFYPCAHAINYSLPLSLVLDDTISAQLEDELLQFVIYSPACQIAATEFLCALHYPPCVQETNASNFKPSSPSVFSEGSSSSSAWPLPCPSLCHQFVRLCADALSSPVSRYHRLRCSYGDEDESNLSSSDEPCTVTDYNGGLPVCPCPETTRYVNDVQCALPCPSPYLNWAVTDGMLVAGSGSSVSLLSVLLLTLMLKHKISVLSDAVFWLAFCWVMLGINIIWSFVYGQDPMRCTNSSDASSSTCTFFAGMMVFFSMATTVWWLCVCGKMLMSVLLDKKGLQRKTRCLMITMHSLAWGVASVSTIIAGGAGILGSGLGLAFCFLNQAIPHKELSYVGLELIIFWVPISVFFIFGMILLALLLVYIHQMTGANGVMRQWRLVVFFCFSFFFGCFLLLSFYILAFLMEEEDLYESEASWEACMLTSDSKNDCPFSAPDPLTLQYINVFAMSFAGVVFFFIMGLTHDNTQWWRQRLKNVLTRRPFFANSSTLKSCSMEYIGDDDVDEDDEEEEDEVYNDELKQTRAKGRAEEEDGDAKGENVSGVWPPKHREEWFGEEQRVGRAMEIEKGGGEAGQQEGVADKTKERPTRVKEGGGEREGREKTAHNKGRALRRVVGCKSGKESVDIHRKSRVRKEDDTSFTLSTDSFSSTSASSSPREEERRRHNCNKKEETTTIAENKAPDAKEEQQEQEEETEEKGNRDGIRPHTTTPHGT